MNRDPLGEAGGIDLYEFVGGNPVSWVDPDGAKRRPFNWRPYWRGKKPGWRPHGRKPPKLNTTPSDPLQDLPDLGDPNSKPIIIPSPGFFDCIEYECKNSCTSKWQTGPFLYPKGKSERTDLNCRCKKYEYYPPGQY